MESERTIRFFDMARKLSKKSEYSHQLGAVVAKKNKVLGLGFNKPYKTHPRSNNRFKTTHAELDAILGLSAEELTGATIYVYRETKDGSPANSKPCQYCQMLIKKAGIKKVCYTDEGKFKEYLTND